MTPVTPDKDRRDRGIRLTVAVLSLLVVALYALVFLERHA